MKWRRIFSIISSINNIIHQNMIIVQPSAMPNLEEGFNCKQAQRVLNVDIARCLFLWFRRWCMAYRKSISTSEYVHMNIHAAISSFNKSM